MERFYFFFFFVLIAAAFDARTTGQSSPPPTVSVRRINALNQAVWPGDFNGDGITDLVASETRPSGGGPPRLVISLGNGDGTFRAPTQLSVSGHVLAVADINGDGRKDLLFADEPPPDEVVAVMFGNGDGTFTGGEMVNTLDFPTFGLVADLNGDGIQDVVLGNTVDDGRGNVQVSPGRSDGFYDGPIKLVSGALPLDGAVADLNGDGRPDIVVANHDGHSLTVFLNQGAFMFTPSDIPFDRQVNDIVARDLNHDGKIDLIAATSRDANDDFNYTQGDATVLRGNGDGTFAPPVSYPTGPGAWQIVAGDFNGDDIVDVATANRSADYLEDCGTLLRGTDSLSILPGRADGTFNAAHTFAIGPQSDPSNTRFRNSVRSLNTSDVNGDARTDLIASWGAIFTTNPPDPNWAPTVDAGPDQTISTPQIHLEAIASDVDQDWLAYSWVDSHGEPVAPVADPCFTPSTPGIHTFTVTVSDGHGHSASSAVTVDFGGGGGEDHNIYISAPATGEVLTSGQAYTIRWTAASEMGREELFFYVSTDGGDTFTHIWECDYTQVRVGQCVWTNPGPASENAVISLFTRDADFEGAGHTGSFSIRTPAGALPWPWLDSDIGAVGAAGSRGFNNGVFTVRGSGADIWGSADRFHYAYQQFIGGTGDIDVVTRVDSVQDVDAWTKAGLMARLGATADSPHASIFITPGKGVAFQRRPTTGAVSVNTSGALITAPAWLRLSVRGSYVIAYYKKNHSDAWIKLGDQKFPNSGVRYVGLAVTSHLDGSVATATFSNVSLSPVEPVWTASLVGSTIGGATPADLTDSFTVTNRGADVWGTSDQFTFVNTSFYGDGDILAWIRAVENTSVWAKAGVMFRSTLATNSPHVSLFVTPGKGIAMQYRASAGATSAQVAQIAGAVPVLLRLTRSGNTFTGAWSPDTTTWHTVGSITVNLGPEALVGMPFTSHNASATAAAEGGPVNVVHR